MTHYHEPTISRICLMIVLACIFFSAIHCGERSPAIKPNPAVKQIKVKPGLNGYWLEDLFADSDREYFDIPSQIEKGFYLRFHQPEFSEVRIDFKWLKFNVSLYTHHRSDNNDALDRVDISDSNGHLLKRLKTICWVRGDDYYINDYLTGEIDPYDMFFADVTGDSVPELFITTGTRGAYSYWTTYVFKAEGNKVRNILDFYSGLGGSINHRRESDIEKLKNDALCAMNTRFGFREQGCIRDIDNDGIPEIITKDNLMKEFMGQTHPEFIYSVFKWNGRSIEDVTFRYPLVAEEAAWSFINSSTDKSFTECNPLGMLGPFYAEMAIAGKEREAREYILKRGDESVRKWLEDCSDDILYRIIDRKDMISTNDSRYINDY